MVNILSRFSHFAAVILLMTIPLISFNSEAAEDTTTKRSQVFRDKQIAPGLDPSVTLEEGGPFSVSVADGRISVDSTNTPIGVILKEIARQQGIKLSLSPAFVPYDVTDKFSQLPLKNGLARLLRNSSYSFVYGVNGAIEELHILPSGKPQPVPAVQTGPQEEVQELPPEPDNLPENTNESQPADTEEGADTNSSIEQRREAIEQLIEKLEANGSGNSTLIENLRKQLAEPVSE